MSREPDILAACAALAEASGALTEARRKQTEAGDNERDALRRVNRLQRDFDQMYSEMKRTAPQGTGWHLNQAVMMTAFDSDDI